jgi:hypothetical protein
MNRLYLVVALFFFSLTLEAQTFYPRIGITASVNTYRPPDYDVKPKVGFTVGVGYNLALSDLISMQAELDYVQKSFESTFSNSSSIQDGDDIYELHVKGSDQYAISYLELPLFLKARILHDNFFVLGGFSIGMGLGGSHKYSHDQNASYFGSLHEEGSGKIKFGDEPPSNGDDVYFDNRWDFGFHVGFGALILKKIQVECRFGTGTVNLNKDADSKNRCLQISFATPIQLKL